MTLEDITDFLSNAVSLSTLAWAVLALIVLIAVLLVWGFFQGREIVIWPPKIGPLPKKADATNNRWPMNPKIIENRYEDRKIYLVKENKRFHIPNMPTLRYLGELLHFTFEDREQLYPNDIKQYEFGGRLPDIEDHCESNKVTAPSVQEATPGAKDDGVPREQLLELKGKVEKLISEAGQLDSVDAKLQWRSDIETYILEVDKGFPEQNFETRRSAIAWQVGNEPATEKSAEKGVKDTLILLRSVKKLLQGKIDTGLTIHLAVWGAKDYLEVVTDKVRDVVENGTLNVQAHRNVLGDPSPGEAKRLVVAYSHQGEANVKSVLENETLTLP